MAADKDQKQEQQKAQAAADKAFREAPGRPQEFTGSQIAQAGAEAQGRTVGDEEPRGRDRLASAAREASVDPRLDNRTGDQRPTRPTEDPAKPQHIDGPEVGHEAEFARRFVAPLNRGQEQGEPLGAKSEGPHGLGPHGVTVGDSHGQPVEAQDGAGDKDDPRNPAG